MQSKVTVILYQCDPPNMHRPMLQSTLAADRIRSIHVLLCLHCSAEALSDVHIYVC